LVALPHVKANVPARALVKVNCWTNGADGNAGGEDNTGKPVRVVVAVATLPELANVYVPTASMASVVALSWDMLEALKAYFALPEVAKL
jgi:hypothetical protein